MKFVKITILAITIIILGIISLSYFTTESNTIVENQTEQTSQLIEWDSGNLFKILVDPKDIKVIDGKTIPMKASFGLKPELNEIYDQIGVNVLGRLKEFNKANSLKAYSQ